MKNKIYMSMNYKGGVYIMKNTPYPFELTFQILRRKWSVLIIWILEGKCLRLSELKKFLNGCSEKVLRETLYYLLEYSIIQKKECVGVYKYTEYSLTNLGIEIIHIIKKANEFGKNYFIEGEKNV